MKDKYWYFIGVLSIILIIVSLAVTIDSPILTIGVSGDIKITHDFGQIESVIPNIPALPNIPGIPQPPKPINPWWNYQSNDGQQPPPLLPLKKQEG